MTQKHLLTTGLDLLDRHAAGEVLLAFDFDGTLAPIVSTPGEAAMRTATARLLSEAARLYPCVVISGRAQADVQDRIGPVPVWELIGNHGLEPSSRAMRFEAQVKRWVPVLRQRLEGVDGVTIEDKGSSVAIHYRQAPRKTEAVKQIVAALELVGPARILGGKMVFNVLPESRLNKGVALEALREKYRCTSAIYVGDDTTDEDVFALSGPKLLAVRVGKKRGSAAPYFLHDQEEIDALLKRLVTLKTPRVQGRLRG